MIDPSMQKDSLELLFCCADLDMSGEINFQEFEAIMTYWKDLRGIESILLINSCLTRFTINSRPSLTKSKEKICCHRLLRFLSGLNDLSQC